MSILSPSSKWCGLLVCFLVIFINSGHSQVSYPGNCPNIKIKRSVKLDLLCGIWYEYERYPFLLEDNQKCIETEIYRNTTGSILIQHRLTSELDEGKQYKINGRAKLIAPGKFNIQYTDIPGPSLDAWLLDTDYTSFAVVYSCHQNILDAHLRYLWIMTRDPVPSPLVQQKAYNVIHYNRLSSSPISELKTDQQSCTASECSNCQHTLSITPGSSENGSGSSEKGSGSSSN